MLFTERPGGPVTGKMLSDVGCGPGRETDAHRQTHARLSGVAGAKAGGPHRAASRAQTAHLVCVSRRGFPATSGWGCQPGTGGVTPGSSQLGRSGMRGEMEAGLDRTASGHLLTLGGSVRGVLTCSGSPSWRPLATVQRGARMEAGGDVGRLPPRPLHGTGVDGCSEPGTGC